MNIAIIEDNVNYQKVLENKINEFNKSNKFDKLKVDFFTDNIDFGKAVLENYDVIISNVYLPYLKGPELLESIKPKTTAFLALMSSKNGWLSKEILNDKKIKTILDKNNPNGIINWLNFVQSRIILNKYNMKVKSTYEECTVELSEIFLNKKLA